MVRLPRPEEYKYLFINWFARLPRATLSQTPGTYMPTGGLGVWENPHGRKGLVRLARDCTCTGRSSQIGIPGDGRSDRRRTARKDRKAGCPSGGSTPARHMAEVVAAGSDADRMTAPPERASEVFCLLAEGRPVVGISEGLHLGPRPQDREQPPAADHVEARREEHPRVPPPGDTQRPDRCLTSPRHSWGFPARSNGS